MSSSARVIPAPFTNATTLLSFRSEEKVKVEVKKNSKKAEVKAKTYFSFLPYPPLPIFSFVITLFKSLYNVTTFSSNS